jgi:beta-lactamase superfamily II metal-dependent hydrolase
MGEKIGTLLMGDINIKSTEDSNKLVNYFAAYLSRIFVFQVPHHGSERNWPFLNRAIFDNFVYYVINHGVGRKGHPSAEVVADIRLRNNFAVIRLSNETQSFSAECYFFI